MKGKTPDSRMYAEKIAEGIVTDPEQRTDYLNAEPGRPSRLIGDVLSYARSGKGAIPLHENTACCQR